MLRKVSRGLYSWKEIFIEPIVSWSEIQIVNIECILNVRIINSSCFSDMCFNWVGAVKFSDLCFWQECTMMMITIFLQSSVPINIQSIKIWDFNSASSCLSTLPANWYILLKNRSINCLHTCGLDCILRCRRRMGIEVS